MKQILIYSLILIALGLVLWFGVINRSTGSRVLTKNAFAYADTASISKVFLADLGDKQILLERQVGGSWMVNGKFSARRDAVETLLYTIAHMETKHPVNKAQYDLAIREIAGNHIKVELYNTRGKRVMTYFVGPPTVRNRGNFMKLDQGRDPYVVHIPGLDGFLQTRFPVDENDWRERVVFRYLPDQIEELSIQYSLNPDSSWVLQRLGENQYHLESSLDSSGKTLNQRAAMAHLTHFRNVHAEAFMNDWVKKDSVLNTRPICTLAVRDRSGETNQVLLYFRPVNQRTKMQFDPFGNPLEFERDKYYASLNGGKDFALVQDFVFGKFFIGPSYFYQAEPAQSRP